MVLLNAIAGFVGNAQQIHGPQVALQRCDLKQIVGTFFVDFYFVAVHVRNAQVALTFGVAKGRALL